MKHPLQHYKKKNISNISFPHLVSVVLKDELVDYYVFFFFFLEHQCDVVSVVCSLSERWWQDSDHRNRRPLSVSVEFSSSSIWILLLSWVKHSSHGAIQLHYSASVSQKKKKVHREKPISNRMKMKIIDDDAGSLNTIRGRCQFHSGSSFLWACRLRAWPEYRTAWSRFKEFEPKRRSLRSDQSSEVLCIHCWFYIFLCEHLLSPSWMNGDTLSFGTSIKCVQHIVLANTPFNKSYDCREGHFTEKRVCHVQSALLLFKWW